MAGVGVVDQRSPWHPCCTLNPTSCGETVPPIFPALPSTYLLLLNLETALNIQVGTLGNFEFGSGWEMPTAWHLGLIRDQDMHSQVPLWLILW